MEASEFEGYFRFPLFAVTCILATVLEQTEQLISTPPNRFAEGKCHLAQMLVED